MHMPRLAVDAERVAHLMETKYKTDMLLDNKILVSHNIELEAMLLRQFPLFFRGLIETAALIQPTDFFGNKYQGYDSYDYIEIIVSYDYTTLSSVRFLGTKDGKPIRFAIYSLPNIIFDPTTLNIVSQIRNLSDSVSDFFGKIFDLFCSPGLNFEEDISNIQNVSALISKINQVDVTSSIGWYNFVTSYFVPGPIIVSRSSLSQEDLEAIESKFSNKLFKSFDDLKNEASDFFGLKSGIVNLAKNGFEINNTAKAAFFTDLPHQIQTLGALYSDVFDVFTLGCLISEALDCIRPPISCPDLLRELPPEALKARIALAFPTNPAILLSTNSLIDRIIKETKDNNLPVSKASDRILDELANIIDVDAICSLQIPFDIPKFQFPQIPTIDLFFDINVQLDTAILEALAKALIDLILGILKDLFDCGKLDNFIAGLLNGQISDDAGAYGDLAKLFSNPQSLGKDSAIADSFGNRWTNFVNQASPLMEKVVDFSTTSSVGTQQVSFNKVTNGDAGLTGLQKLFLSGSFKDVGPALEITKQPDTVTVDVTNLDQVEPGQAHKFITEVNTWELASNKNSFTLNNLSDDRVTIIARVAQSAPINVNKPSERSEALLKNIKEGHDSTADSEQTQEQKQGSHLEKISGEEIFKEIGKMFDTIISVLSPTETINLLAGKATLETLNTVLEITKIRHKRLYLFINTIQKVSTVFELFGKSAGLDSLRDKLLLLTASPEANKALVPMLPCPPFEDVFKFRKELLKRTLPEDQVVKIIDDLIDAGKKRFNDIQTGLIKVQAGAPLESLKPILCGTGKGPGGTRSPVVEDSLNSTLGLMFDPTRMMFDREIGKYVDAVSVTKEKQVQIPRKVSLDNNIPIFNPGASDGNVFSSLSSLLGLADDQEAENKQSDRVNPEFKKMLNSGFIPVVKTGDKQSDFKVEEGKDKDYVDGTEPIFKKNTVKKPGAAFKEGIQFKDEDIDLDLNRKFKITLKGSLDTQSPVSAFTPFKVPSPEWIIEYTEKNVTTFNVRTGGQIHSSVYGLIPFSENYRIQKDEIFLEDDLKQEIENVSNSSIILPRQNVFNKIFENKVLPHLLNKENVKESFDEMFEERFEDFIKATIREIGGGFARNRLLRKVPNSSLNKLAPEGLSLGSSNVDDLIALNMINFSPVQTEKQRLCNVDPHLLDFDQIKKIVKDRFDKECEEEEKHDKIDGLKPRRGPINSAGFVGLVMTIIRLYSIEYILRSLFILDEFKFSKDFTEDDLFIDYVTFRMQSDIQRLDFYHDFEREALVAYQKLLEDGVIEPYSNKLNACATDGLQAPTTSIKSELKALVKFQMESAMERIVTIIGVDKNKEVSLKSIFFDGLEILDTFSDFGDPSNNSQYTSNNQRFTDIDIPKSGKFILERYIKVSKPNKLFVNAGTQRAAIELEQNTSPNLQEVINFNNWEEFISKMVSNNILLQLDKRPIFDPNHVNASLFEKPWKMGLRLVYIPPSFGDKTARGGMVTRAAFKITKPHGEIIFSALDPIIVDDKKSYYLFDKQPQEKAFLTEDKTEYFKQYNPIPILEKEIEITDFITFGEANKKDIFEKIFNTKYSKVLKQRLFSDPQMDVVIDYCLFSKRLLTLFMIHSTLILNSEQMKFLFEGTKLELKKLFHSLKTLGSYVNQNEFKLKGGNALEFARKFNRIGSPEGPSGADAFYYWMTTPIHILKALAVMTDPNIFWTDKIVAAAASGYLAPRLARIGSSVRIDGESRFVNATAGIALDNDFKMLPTGEIIKLKKQNGPIGKPFIEFTPVALIDSVVDGVVNITQEPYPDGSKGPAIRAGAAFVGIPWDKLNNGPEHGINLDSFNPLFDERPSVPVYPGEKITLPYGLVSLALTPIQVFATILGPLCQTMYNPGLPLGQEFLAWEPLIYQLPHFQIASADTSVADDLKETGIDLKGADQIGCDDKNKK